MNYEIDAENGGVKVVTDTPVGRVEWTLKIPGEHIRVKPSKVFRWRGREYTGAIMLDALHFWMTPGYGYMLKDERERQASDTVRHRIAEAIEEPIRQAAGDPALQAKARAVAAVCNLRDAEKAELAAAAALEAARAATEKARNVVALMNAEAAG